MNTAYGWLKFLHVAGVIGWLGGAAALAILNVLTSKRPTAGSVKTFVEYAQGLGARMLGPAAGVALLAGVGTMLVGHLGMPLWIVWAIIATVLFILVGVLMLRPVLQRLTTAAAAGAGEAELSALLRRQRMLMAINLVLLLTALWAMVAKP